MIDDSSVRAHNDSRVRFPLLTQAWIKSCADILETPGMGPDQEHVLDGDAAQKNRGQVLQSMQAAYKDLKALLKADRKEGQGVWGLSEDLDEESWVGHALAAMENSDVEEAGGFQVTEFPSLSAALSELKILLPEAPEGGERVREEDDLCEDQVEQMGVSQEEQEAGDARVRAWLHKRGKVRVLPFRPCSGGAGHRVMLGEGAHILPKEAGNGGERALSCLHGLIDVAGDVSSGPLRGDLAAARGWARVVGSIRMANGVAGCWRNVCFLAPAPTGMGIEGNDVDWGRDGDTKRLHRVGGVGSGTFVVLGMLICVVCARVLHSTKFAFACASVCALVFVLLRIYCYVPIFLYTHTRRWPLGADGLSNFQCARYVHPYSRAHAFMCGDMGTK